MNTTPELIKFLHNTSWKQFPQVHCINEYVSRSPLGWNVPVVIQHCIKREVVKKDKVPGYDWRHEASRHERRGKAIRLWMESAGANIIVTASPARSNPFPVELQTFWCDIIRCLVLHRPQISKTIINLVLSSSFYNLKYRTTKRLQVFNSLYWFMTKYT